jgi:hypothetical protein
MIYDFVILGGGISGLYTCYRLLQKNPHYKIALFEKNNYWGGRIKTFYKAINHVDYQMEEGAGRFNDHHKILKALIVELGLEKDMIQIGGKTTFLDTNHVFPSSFNHQSSFTYIDKVISKACHEDISYLQQFTFVDYAKKILSKEEINFMLQASGYATDLLLLNAFDACIMFKYHNREDIRYFILKHGLSSLIQKLVEKIKKLGGKNHTHLFLNSIIHEFYFDSYNKLFFIQQYSNENDKSNGKIKNNVSVIECKQLICALPKKNLLSFSYFQKYKYLLNSVHTNSLCRIYAVYEEPWFKKISKTITNNPLRYVIPINKENGLIMISYINGKEIDYWKPMIHNNERMDNQFEDKKNNNRNNNKNKQLKVSLHKNINQVFQINTKNPIFLKSAYWEIGIHLWKSGRNSLELSKKIVHLNHSIPLFIVGESYSISQGWIEGALETSHLCLEKIHA